MEKVILNGEIFLKKNPKIETKILTNSNAIPEVFDVNGKVIEEFDFTNPEHLKLLPPSVLYMFESMGAIKRIERRNYEDNVGFYQIVVGKNEFHLVNKGYKSTYKYNSLEEVEREFISLFDYMHHAIYVGRFLEPIEPPIIRFECLYEYAGIYILRDLTEDKYQIISKDHPFLENYRIGKMLPAYYEKEELLKAIVSQELKPNNPRKM